MLEVTVTRFVIQGRIQVLWGLKFIIFLGPSLRKRIQNYEYKMRHASEELFGMRKGIITNYEF